MSEFLSDFLAIWGWATAAFLAPHVVKVGRLKQRLAVMERAAAQKDDCLQGMLGIVTDSRGVAGYHRNGEIAEWDEFPEIAALRAVAGDAR